MSRELVCSRCGKRYETRDYHVPYLCLTCQSNLAIRARMGSVSGELDRKATEREAARLGYPDAIREAARTQRRRRRWETFRLWASIAVLLAAAMLLGRYAR